MIQCGFPTIDAGLAELAAYSGLAEAPLFRATAPELGGVSGRYYNRCRQARCNPLADDAVLGRELWDRSESAVS
jgi:hypothetical protein